MSRRRALMSRLLAIVAASLSLCMTPLPGAAQETLAGSWHGSVTVNGMACTFDRVMTPTGTYSEIERCGSLVTGQRGTYKVFPNHVIGFSVSDWMPKQRYVVDAVPGSGHYEPNAQPPGGTFRYTFTSPDTMVWRDVNFGGTIVYHRVRR
jgi:hypothetical protein